jgi:hypothetical protein
MQRSRLAIAAIVAAGAFSCAASLAADHDAIKPYLVDDVDDIGFIDLAKINITAALDELAKLGVVPEPQVAEARQKAAAIQQIFSQLPELGARRAYVLVRDSDLAAGGVTWIIEAGDGADKARIIELIKPWLAAAQDKSDFGELGLALPKELAVAGNMILGAPSAERLDAIKSAPPATPRPEALAALAALNDADAGVVVFGSVDGRRVIREMFPAIPPPFAEIDGRLLADGVAWIALTAKLPPEPKVALAVQALDAETATTLDRAADRALVLGKALYLTELVGNAPVHRAHAATMGVLLPMLDPKLDGTLLSVTFGDDPREIETLKNAMTPMVKSASDAAGRAQKMNSFKQILLAMHNYASAKGSFPPPASHSDDGKPLLSWRVLILPYIEEMELYKQFHLDEPWDSEHNRTLIDKMPAVYRDPVKVVVGGDAGRTTCLVPTGEKTMFPDAEALEFRQVTDGTSQTMALVDAVPELAVVWTKPDDWEVDLKDPLRGVKRTDGDGFIAGYADGSVRFVPNDIDPAKLAAIVTATGGEVVEP